MDICEEKLIKIWHLIITLKFHSCPKPLYADSVQWVENGKKTSMLKSTCVYKKQKISKYLEDIYKETDLVQWVDFYYIVSAQVVSLHFDLLESVEVCT